MPFGVSRHSRSPLDTGWRCPSPRVAARLGLAPRGAFCCECANGRQGVLRQRQAATIHDRQRRSAPERDSTCWGKMWDCKTSKMSQSPHAALNAFGLFATGLLGEQGHTCSQGGGRHSSGAVRHFTSARSSGDTSKTQGPTAARVLMAFSGRGALHRGHERDDFSIVRASRAGARGAPPRRPRPPSDLPLGARPT